MRVEALYTFFFLSAIISIFQVEAFGSVRFKNSCIDGAPVVPPPEERRGCCVLPFINQIEFGNNSNSEGTLTATPLRNSLKVRIRLKKLSRPNLALTAWLLYSLPFDPTASRIQCMLPHIAFTCSFLSHRILIVHLYCCYTWQYGYLANPLTATYAEFTSGLGRESNEFRYSSRTSALLDVNLDFNPTYPVEESLAFATLCNQKEISGIQGTERKQPKIVTTGVPYPNYVFVPVGSHYLQKYDPATRFERLDSKGRQLIVRSPFRAYAVAIDGHR